MSSFWRKKEVLILGTLLWLVYLTLIAQFSGFHADTAKSINWAVALMLTPSGLIGNLLLGANEFVRHVYFLAPPPPVFSLSFESWNWHYLQIFAQSNGLEVLPLLFLWPRWRPMGLSAVRITLLNSVTHPIVFFLIMRLPTPYLANILLAETFAVLAEGYVYRALGLPRPFAASLFANLVSWQLAPVLTVYFFLWDRLV